jgi:hypothetical protein
MTPMSIDHLVVAADTLDHGVQWCEATLGVTPGPGGQHPLMGTHNRVLRISTQAYPQAYLEIIAVDPDAPSLKRKRWFDLDDAMLLQKVRQRPRLMHFVARTDTAVLACKALQQLGIDRGELLHAERPTASGQLRWCISVRADGQRLFYGGLPTIIEWQSAHPSDALPDSGVTLQSLRVSHPRAPALGAAYAAIALEGVTLEEGPPNLQATLSTPQGIVTLESEGC